MTSIERRYILHKAYHAFVEGEPVAFDVYNEMLQAGMNPERILELFSEGAEVDDILTNLEMIEH